MTIKCINICVFEKKVVLLQPQKPGRVPCVMYNRDKFN